MDGLFNRATSMGSPGIDYMQWRKPVLVAIPQVEGAGWTPTLDAARPGSYVPLHNVRERTRDASGHDVRLFGDVQRNADG